MLKFLTFPLRLFVGWGLSPRLLGWPGITMLVLLRLTIGWHFYSEGLEKYQAGDWDAAPFFSNAKGPLAPQYRELVWDWDGQIRLDKDQTMVWWATFRDRAGDYYGFSDAQKQQAQANYAKAVEAFDYVLELNCDDLEEYRLGRERVDSLDVDPTRSGVTSLRGQRDTIRREWTAKVAPTLRQLDKIWENYEDTQNAVATIEQTSGRPPLELGRPQTQPIDTLVINKIVPYFDMAIGICLLLGLFTPVAALAAAGFLGSVFLSQYPPTTGPTSTMYQLIECMACLVLAGTGAGRFAGLDFFWHLIVRRVWAPRADWE